MLQKLFRIGQAVPLASIMLFVLQTSLAYELAPQAQHGSRSLSRRSESTPAQLHEREFISPQVRVQMDCRQNETTIRANFTRPFSGILGVGTPATTKCKLVGSGQLNYELHVPHNATDLCDARWDNTTSSIANTLFIRFHQSLETGADIAKNVLCRLAVGNLVVGRRPSGNPSTARQKLTRGLRPSPIIRAQR